MSRINFATIGDSDLDVLRLCLDAARLPFDDLGLLPALDPASVIRRPANRLRARTEDRGAIAPLRA